MSYQDDLHGQSRSLAATATAFGISRERVRQIVTKEGKDQDGQDRTGGSDTPPPA